MNPWMIATLVGVLWGVQTAAHAAEAVPGVAQPVASAEGKAHTREQATAVIRQHHLQRLYNRVHLDPSVLHQTCRYESEIATAPPARRVVLSFDDGPEPGQTERILEVLKKHEVKGAFFLIGEKASTHPDLVGKILQEGGHTVANHSWSHPNFHDITASQQAQEVLKYEEAPSAGPVKRLFRYPYGNSSCETNGLLHERGYRIVGWHVDSCDWAFDKTGRVDSREALACGVLAQNRDHFVDHVVSSVRAHNGGIVLLHEIHPNTIRQLDDIIVRLKNEGFAFGSIEDEDLVSSLR
jgi:peptidoglycan-N-acetylglucosamine deacetylase